VKYPLYKMETIKLTEFKDIISGKYMKDNKEYPLIFGIREKQNGNRFLTMIYIDRENNKANILLNWEIDELKDRVTLKVLKSKKLSEKIEEYKAVIKNFKEFFKIIKSIELFNIIKNTLRLDIKLDIKETDLTYWIYNKIYFGEMYKDDFFSIISAGKDQVIERTELYISDIAKQFIERGLDKGEEKNLTIEI